MTERRSFRRMPLMLGAGAAETVSTGWTGPPGREGPLWTPGGSPPALMPSSWDLGELIPTPKDVPLGIRYIDVPTPASSGRLLDAAAAFPIRGVEIDNYSRLYLYLPSIARYIPPYTFGYSCPVHFAPNKIEIHAQAPPAFLQIAALATESFSVTCKEVELTYSPGFPLPPQPGNVNSGNYASDSDTVARTLAVPTNGKVIGITLLATAAGSATWKVNALPTVTVPASSQLGSGVNGQLVAPSIVFAGQIASWLVEWVI